MKKIVAFMLAALVAVPFAASADPWKDESGHGKRRYWEQRKYDKHDHDDHYRGRGYYRDYESREYFRPRIDFHGSVGL
ncbi:hypothetical protein TKWG_06540 [Advenella kashmirensis WT001]|uniref:Uncharacterized protein n=1 Tax=Advenella kashmirensis (strain DSM 17095 / LMG 22695 / WT001) TaxID=1036672 RepID=I3U9R1_ADVKW|nr:hypothetical protein [Advenella kashmirensis]AFK61749.1 hypothetical protein TKWG_06540 [Advenella kashmirensis WT001]